MNFGNIKEIPYGYAPNLKDSIGSQKELMIKGGYKGAEPNMVMESKEEVINTIAKKDFDKTSLIQNTCVGCPPSYSFRIKKGDPIEVIKTTNIGTTGTSVFYQLRKHNGENFAKTKSETSKMPIPDNSNFKGWANLGSTLSIMGLGEYNLPKDVVEESTIMEKAKDIVSVNPNDTPEKKYNKNLIKYGLIALAGLIVYRLVSKKQVQP
jgi:hypothetical protein